MTDIEAMGIRYVPEHSNDRTNVWQGDVYLGRVRHATSEEHRGEFVIFCREPYRNSRSEHACELVGWEKTWDDAVRRLIVATDMAKDGIDIRCRREPLTAPA